MSSISLSEAERTFIVHGIEDGVRADGRSREDFRHLELETGVVSNTNGSARVRLGHTDVLVGVKAEVGEPRPSAPAHGRLEFFVDCSANAAPEFEGRGGETLAMEIANVLSTTVSGPGSLNTESLGIVPGEQCWVLFVDVVVLECGGDLMDSVSIAVKSALRDVRVPRVRVRVDPETERREIELSDDPTDCLSLDVRRVPLLVTIAKIGHAHVVDPTAEEEACSMARVVMGVRADGTVTHARKAGGGALDPKSVVEMTRSGRSVGRRLDEALTAALDREGAMGEERRVRGFLD